LPQHKTYQELLAANYEVLTGEQTGRLLRFADGVHACMSKDVAVRKPRPLRTRIVMTFVPVRAPRLLLWPHWRVEARWAAKGSSLVVRKRLVVLFLPKYCLLDGKVVARSQWGREEADRPCETLEGRG
jgi:hypothetical protein